MKTWTLFLLLFLLSSITYAQDNLIEIKSLAIQNIKDIRTVSKTKILNENILSELFCEQIVCSICEDDKFNTEFGISRNKLKLKDLKKISEIIKLKKLKSDKITVYEADETDKQYFLGYSLLPANSRTGLEGAGLLIRFKKEDSKIKFYGIQTIP